MNKYKSSKFVLAVAVIVGFVFTFCTPVAAKTPNSPYSFVNDAGDGFQKNFSNKALKGFWLKLTEQQQKKLRRAIKMLKDQGATPEQIKEMIHEYLRKWGIKNNIKRKIKKGFWEKLTREQKRELSKGIKKLKKQKATRKEIKAYIKTKLKEWGLWPKK